MSGAGFRHVSAVPLVSAFGLRVVLIDLNLLPGGVVSVKRQFAAERKPYTLTLNRFVLRGRQGQEARCTLHMLLQFSV